MAEWITIDFGKILKPIGCTSTHSYTFNNPYKTMDIDVDANKESRMQLWYPCNTLVPTDNHMS